MTGYSILGGLSFKLSKDTQQVEAGLNVRIATWNDTAATLADDTKRFRETPPEKLPPKMQEVGSGLYARRLSLLRDELVILGDLVRYYNLVERDRFTAAEKAAIDHEELKAKVRSDLLRIGYVDGLIPLGNHNCIQPQFIFNHPAVFAARITADGLQRQSFTQNIEQHEARAGQVRREIEAIKNRSLTTV